MDFLAVFFSINLLIPATLYFFREMVTSEPSINIIFWFISMGLLTSAFEKFSRDKEKSPHTVLMTGMWLFATVIVLLAVNLEWWYGDFNQALETKLIMMVPFLAWFLKQSLACVKYHKEVQKVYVVVHTPQHYNLELEGYRLLEEERNEMVYIINPPHKELHSVMGHIEWLKNWYQQEGVHKIVFVNQSQSTPHGQHFSVWAKKHNVPTQYIDSEH